MTQLKEIIKNQTSRKSNQEEWNNIIKAMKASAEKTIKKKKWRPKHSALFIDSERYQHQIKLH